MADYQMKTVNGFDYYEAMSALQKAIRRGEEEEAVFWAIEFFESNYVGHIWNRLFIIAHEDIGLADPYFPGKIMALKNNYDYLEEHRPKKVSKRLVFLQTILMFVRAKKSRYVDLAYSVYWSQHKQLAVGRKIPDYAFDMHTKRGKQMGRGLDHFYDEGAKINNRAEIQNEVEFEKAAKEIDKGGVVKLDETEIDPAENGKTSESQPDLFDFEKQRETRRNH